MTGRWGRTGIPNFRKLFITIGKVYISPSTGNYTVINVPMKELSVCHVFKNGSLLLIKTADGINKDKWNAPGGEIVQGEKPNKAAMKYLYQQTGLYSTKVADHGTVRLALSGKSDFSYKLHIFSTKSAAGELKPNIQGEAKWFNLTDIPYFDMWADDRYWINLVMQGKQFDADFFFDEKNEKVVKYQIKERQQVSKKVIPIAVLILVIAIVGYGVFASGVLKAQPSTGIKTTIPKNTLFTPANSVQASTSSTTIVSTSTIPPPPVPIRITIDNIDMSYVYSGPSQQGGVDCNQPSKTVVLNYHRIVNTSTFLLNTSIGTNGCPLTVTSIQSTTPGFTIESIVPNPSQTIPAQSSIYFEIVINTQDKSFIGPLSLTMNDQ